MEEKRDVCLIFFRVLNLMSLELGDSTTEQFAFLVFIYALHLHF
jgi:hypothetical protein